MPRSILEAIEQGVWDYEPQEKVEEDCESTDALPGSPQKLDVLAERLEQGLPLWHPNDRQTFSETGDWLN